MKLLERLAKATAEADKRRIIKLMERTGLRKVERQEPGRDATNAELVAVGALTTFAFEAGAALGRALDDAELSDGKSAFEHWPLGPHVEECYVRALNSVLALNDGRDPGEGDLAEACATAQATILETSARYGTPGDVH